MKTNLQTVDGPGVNIRGTSVSATRLDRDMAGVSTHTAARSGCNVHPAHSLFPTDPDPEADYAIAQGERLNLVQQLGAWLGFRLLIAAFAFERWYTLKRVCAWCQPMKRMSGNPWARTVTHGICPDCFALKRRELDARKAAHASRNTPHAS